MSNDDRPAIKHLTTMSVEVTWLEPRLEIMAALLGTPLSELSQDWDTHIVRGTE